jgi:hypothetical protein
MLLCFSYAPAHGTTRCPCRRPAGVRTYTGTCASARDLYLIPPPCPPPPIGSSCELGSLVAVSSLRTRARPQRTFGSLIGSTRHVPRHVQEGTDRRDGNGKPTAGWSRRRKKDGGAGRHKDHVRHAAKWKNTGKGIRRPPPLSLVAR